MSFRTVADDTPRSYSAAIVFDPTGSPEET
jgi:hypothetical protein